MGSPPATLCSLGQAGQGAQLSAASDQRPRTDHGPCPHPSKYVAGESGCRPPSRPGSRVEPHPRMKKLRTHAAQPPYTRIYSRRGPEQHRYPTPPAQTATPPATPGPYNTRQQTRREHLAPAKKSACWPGSLLAPIFTKQPVGFDGVRFSQNVALVSGQRRYCPERQKAAGYIGDAVGGTASPPAHSGSDPTAYSRPGDRQPRRGYRRVTKPFGRAAHPCGRRPGLSLRTLAAHH
jgi:hypothetical protein